MGPMLPTSILLCAFWATYEGTGNTVKVWGDLAVMSMFIFLAGYAVIINSFSFTYIPEILPMAIRAAVVACGFGICQRAGHYSGPSYANSYQKDQLDIFHDFRDWRLHLRGFVLLPVSCPSPILCSY
jgi:hypothetical protein